MFSVGPLNIKIHDIKASALTNEAPQPQWSLVGRSVAAEEVNRHARQGDADTDQGVYGVTVERHHHQEDGEETENDGVDETELWEEKRI